MRNILSLSSALLLLLALVVVNAAADEQQSASQGGTVTPIATDKIQWIPSEAPFPPGAFSAVLDGDMSKPGPFTLRFKMPPGYTIAPHWHSSTELVTILEGKMSVTSGTAIDKRALNFLGAGSFFIVHDHDPHYAVVGDEWTIIQVSAEGPFDIHFVKADGSEIQQQ